MGYTWNKKGTPEGKIQLQILRYLRARGFVAGKTKTQGTFDPKIRSYRIDRYNFVGFPDITAFVPSLLFIEVKSETGVQSEHQVKFQSLCKVANIPYVLARSLEDVIVALPPQ